MANFEVHIPAADPSGFNVTFKVKADNWMAALKVGMQKLGEQGANGQNVMVDMQDDNTIHVTEAASGRVFRIRELNDAEVAQTQPKRPSGIQRAPKPADRGPKTDPALPAVQARDSSADQTLPPGKVPAVAEPPPAKSNPFIENLPTVTDKPKLHSKPSHKSSPRIEPKEVEELEQPVKPVVGQIGRPKTKPGQQAVMKQTVEDVLADVFLRVTDITARATEEEVLSGLVDLAMEKVPCESASALKADGATGDLSFISARGPKAKELLASKLVIPAGRGIASFCASEGVSVAVSDVEKDPRFYGEVGEKVDYETKSLLCAPMMTHGRSFGCLQLINRSSGPHFAEHEVGVLSYIAHQAALYMNQHG